MLKRIRERMNEDEGFTLIELMVVVLIIAILIAIAIPTFLGARERAQDRAAQSSLRNALTAAKTIFTDNENYGDADVSALSDAEPSLSFVAAGTASAGPTSVSVDPDGRNNDSTSWAAVALSSSGKCFGISDDLGSGGPGTEFATDEDNDGGCSADGFQTATLETGWNGDGFTG